MTKALSLDEIGIETGTDKSSMHHGYLDFYEMFFETLRDKPVRILEIGVLGGASVMMWEEILPLWNSGRGRYRFDRHSVPDKKNQD